MTEKRRNPMLKNGVRLPGDLDPGLPGCRAQEPNESTNSWSMAARPASLR
jgi:hypothetical protein